MNMKLSEYEIQDLIERLQKGENIPQDYKYKLFPTKQKEYELVYGGKMRKEDILANEDGVFPVPLQVEKTFNGQRESWKDGWKNIIAFGDNLQFLKTIYENKDPLIKDKVKGKVKLIYIDPPFATADEFQNKQGAKAYNDKKKGAEFVEFLRKRLVVAREILADDGSIYIHLDQKMGHYIKVLMDEIFGKNNFISEIIWKRTGARAQSNFINPVHDLIYFYSKDINRVKWISYRIPYSQEYIDKYYRHTDKDGRKFQDTSLIAPGKGYQFEWKEVTKGWRHNKEKFEKLENEDRIYYTKAGVARYKRYLDEMEGIPPQDIWSDISNVNSQSGERLDYPTQKPEELIERIIKASSNEGDIVLDFFGGSGTTVTAAEKLNRKWISCDIGKLSFYTIQKRILNIETSKSLENPKKKHGKNAKSFLTINTGQYDLEKVFDLKHKDYSDFVLRLFEIEPIKKTISGIKIDGERKDGYYALIWRYWEHKDTSVDEVYLDSLHSNIGKKVGDRIYIVAPANYVNFISDYYEIDNVRYYFLKVPYHIIKELHKIQFKKFRQPQSKKNVNDLEDAVGFHFMKQPDLITELSTSKTKVKISIKKFHSDFSEDEKGKELENFESLAMVLIDKSFNGQAFDMDEYYFAEDLLPKKKGTKDDGNVGEELKETKEINLPAIPRKECGKALMIIYVDVFGNEFKEKFEIK